MLGLPAGSGSRTLVIANPGEDETRASVRLVSEESTFAPTGLDDPVRIPPGGVVRVNLGDLLSGPAAAGVLGVLVEAADEVTVGLRSLVGGDLSHALAGSPEVEGTTAPLPPGAKRLVLAGATSPAWSRVSSWTADGDRLPEVRIEVGPDRGATTAFGPPGGGGQALPRAHCGPRRGAGAGERDRDRPVAPGGDGGTRACRPSRPGLTWADLGRPGLRRACRSGGRRSSGSTPSSSATCSTTTVSTSCSRSPRLSARCSIGRRNSTMRAGVVPAPGTSEASGTDPSGPLVGHLRGVLDGVLDQAEPILPAQVDVGDDVEGEPVEPLALRGQLGVPGSTGHHGGSPHPATPSITHAASLSVVGAGPG